MLQIALATVLRSWRCTPSFTALTGTTSGTDQLPFRSTSSTWQTLPTLMTLRNLMKRSDVSLNCVCCVCVCVWVCVCIVLCPKKKICLGRVCMDVEFWVFSYVILYQIGGSQHTHTHTHTHSYTHSYTHTHTHKHAHTRSHTHSHTHTHITHYFPRSLQWGQWRFTERLGLPKLHIQRVWGAHSARSSQTLIVVINYEFLLVLVYWN